MRELDVGLKSRPRPFFFAQREIQFVEMFRRDGVAVNFFAAELAVDGVQVQAMLSRDERIINFFQIGAQFVRRARFAGMISGLAVHASERAAAGFEAAHVVALPAMERDGNGRENFQRVINVHAEARRIALWPARISLSVFGFIG